MEEVKLICLDERWVSIAIDNRDDLGDVGSLNFKFLEQVLPHCSKDQLVHIEKSTRGRDLSPITDKLWKKFFERDFGVKATDEVIEKMKIKKVIFKWSELYQAKLKRVEEAEKEAGERLKNLYQKESARKQSRQVRVLDKVPPSSSSSNKRSGSNAGKKLMKRVRKEYLNCLEVKNLEAAKMKRTAKCSGLIKKPRTTLQATNVF